MAAREGFGKIHWSSEPHKENIFYFCMWHWWTATRKLCKALGFTFSRRHSNSERGTKKKKPKQGKKMSFVTKKDNLFIRKKTEK